MLEAVRDAFSKGHRPQREPGYNQASLAQSRILHCVFLLFLHLLDNDHTLLIEQRSSIILEPGMETINRQTRAFVG